MSSFTVPQAPKITKENDKKWYVSYIINYDELVDGKYKHYRKENGLKNYGIKINKANSPEERQSKADELLDKVTKDLHAGVDPFFKFFNRVEKHRQKIEQEKKVEEEKISLDQAIELTAVEKGWTGKIAEGKDITASNMLSLYRNDFGRYLRSINKFDDIIEVNRLDIRNWIELHFNSTDAFLNEKGKRIYKNWSSSSCETNKNSISIIFNVLLNKDLIANNPCLNIKIKSDSEKIHQQDSEERYELWTQEELDIFWAETDNDRLRLFNVIGKSIHYSFIRKSELFRIRATMIDFENERFRIPAKLTKSAKKYKSPNEIVSIDIPDSLLESLKKWILQIYPNGFTSDDYLFPHKKDTKNPYNYKTFNADWIQVRKQLKDKYSGLFNKNIYALKHNGISAYFHHLLEDKSLSSAQVTLEIQTLARHSSFQETENYLRNHNLLFKQHRNKANF